MCGCDNSKSDSRPLKEITQYDDRRCTDLLFLFLFVAFWGLTVAGLVYAADRGGSPEKMYRGVDMYGRICGVDNGVRDSPYAAWPWPPEYNAKICVENCKQTLTDPHMALPLASTKFLYYCIPVNFENATFSDQFNSAVESAERYFGDLITAFPVIGGSLGFALFVAFAYAYLMEYCASCLVWGCILLTLCGGTFLGYSLLEAAEEYKGTVSSDRVEALTASGWVVCVATAIFLVVVLFLRRRIQLAARVVQEAAHVLRDIKTLVLFPLVPISMAILYFIFWIYVALMIYSCGTDTVEPTPAEVLWTYGTHVSTGNPLNMTVHHWDSSLNSVMGLHFFGLLWNSQFLIYFGYMIVAGTVADWYFSAWETPKEKKRGNGMAELGASPVWESVVRVVRFHLGSIALGALIIAIISFLRSCLRYIQEKSAAKQNAMTRCMFACVDCCVGCLKCCLDQMSKNAFVWTSIWGDNFCQGACSSFALIWRNLARVAAIHLVGEALMTVGKFTVAILTTGVCAFIFINVDSYSNNLNSPVLPCAVIFLMSYLIAALFMIVFETAIDTTFLCFLVDHEHNKGGQMLASETLQALVDAHAEDSRTAAAVQRSFATHKGHAGGEEENDYQPLSQ